MFVIVLVSITVAGNVQNCSGPVVIKLFSCSTQLSMEFQMLIKSKMLKNKDNLSFRCSDVVFIMLINIKMPTIVGILTFMSMINFMLS